MDATDQPTGQAGTGITVVIPNWNGEAFIVRCVSSALQAAREHRRETGDEVEVLVVDDASTDRSVELLRRDCPAARLAVREHNGGFAEAVNQGVREARGAIVILLNSDMTVRPDFVTRLAAPLADESVFAVTAKSVDWASGAPDHLNMTARLARGQFVLEYSDPPEACDTLLFHGGAFAIRWGAFAGAGGFPALFHPGYWEDYDLSLRAVKAGWRVVYEPRALAHHLGKASLTARYGNEGVRRMAERNRLLFTWLNLTGPGTILRHCLGLPGWIARDLARGRATRLRAFVAAAKRLPAVLRRRRHFPPPRALSDHQALERTRPPHDVAVTVVPGEL